MELIDAEELSTRYTVEELSETAEQYFARLSDWNFLLSKPFGSGAEAPVIVGHLAAMLSALALTPGMDVLDFGAGSCWTSRMYTQLGCRVIACDVSASALTIGRRLYELHPPVGAQPAPTFLHFDGHHIDLPDASVDRVACMDAFHHVPNRGEVLAELQRVLRPGGIAVMAEGGPNHSRTPQSQSEMRSYQVVERDIVVHEFAIEAEAAGFADTLVGIYAASPAFVPADIFEDELTAGRVAADAARSFMDNHRLLRLSKAGTIASDSRSASALWADLEVAMSGASRATVRVRNAGAGTWLGLSSGVGAVSLGIHLFDEDDRLIDLDFHRERLSEDPSAVVPPGEIIDLEVAIPALPPGRHRLEFDLVSENIAWFGLVGSPTVSVWVDA